MENESELNFDAEVPSHQIRKKLRVAIKKKEEIMSNYPPGVTGNEYEIAGADYEIECPDWECTSSHYYIKVVKSTIDHFKSLREYMKGRRDSMTMVDKLNLYRELDTIEYTLRYASEPFEEPCGYKGEVIKEVYRGSVFWSCPQCGETYEEDEEGFDDYFE